MILLDYIKPHYDNRTHIKFSICDLINISWDDVFESLSLNIAKNNIIRLLDGFGIILNECNNIDQVFQINQEFLKLNPNMKCTSHMYISLSNYSQTFGWHNDFCDVLFIQAIGKTFFEVKESDQNFQYTLEKNDCLFIPKTLYHNTKPLTPRVGISLGLE